MERSEQLCKILMNKCFELLIPWYGHSVDSSVDPNDIELNRLNQMRAEQVMNEGWLSFIGDGRFEFNREKVKEFCEREGIKSVD